MLLRLRPLATAAILYCGCAAAQAAPAALESISVMDQAGTLPDDFRDHFFDVPLVVRVEKDGRHLGDARALVSRDNTLSLIDFAASHDSPLPEPERARWLAVLRDPRPLGPCHRDCREGLERLHYSLESSLVSIATREGGASERLRHHALPDGGSRGLILRHQLNVHAGEGADAAGRYALDLQGSLGAWTTVGAYQADRGSEARNGMRHAVQSLYAQRELGDAFVRAGYFLPTYQGVTRQPRGPGSSRHTAIGVMAGSSDSLVVDTRAPSLYPVYVTASREGALEVYRDGALILSQALQPGLQQVDTRRLPGGIYDVELRIIEDGRETSRETALIHKPSHWGDPSRRWRYSAFVGQQRSLFDSAGDPDRGRLAAGAIVNYLAHARAVLGLSAHQVGDHAAVAASVDWHANDWANLYTNAYATRHEGRGLDIHGLLRYRRGTVTASHNRSWQARRSSDDPSPAALPVQERGAGWLQTSAVGVSHRVDDRSHLSGRVSRHQGVSRGVGMDLSFSRRQQLFGTDATWRTSIFERPANLGTGARRDRGVDFTLSLALGEHGRRYSGSLGSRTGTAGGRDLYAAAGVQQTFEAHTLRSLAGQATVDREGLGLSGNARFEHPLVHGDAYAQRTSQEGHVGGGLNLESTIALGAGRLAVIGAAPGGSADTGMIVDVSSDLPDVALRADDSRGGSHVLRPGRNFVPVAAYGSGALQIDFEGRAAPAAAIQPGRLSYHLNKGGVAYGKVDIVSTVTVMGRLQDAGGQPLGGAHIHNHAGRSVAEADGFFTLELSVRSPALQVRHPRVQDCTFVLDGTATRPPHDTWMAGILQCPDNRLTATTVASDASRGDALP
jgi:hypothetical protein